MSFPLTSNLLETIAFKLSSVYFPNLPARRVETYHPFSLEEWDQYANDAHDEADAKQYHAVLLLLHKPCGHVDAHVYVPAKARGALRYTPARLQNLSKQKIKNWGLIVNIHE